MRILIFILIILLNTAGAAKGPAVKMQGATTSVFLGFKMDKINIDRVTYYHNTPQQTDDTPNITASGYRLTGDSKVIAVSRDLLKKYPYGTEVFLKIGGKLERYTVQDVMNKRYRNSIDVFVPNGGRVYPEGNLYIHNAKFIEISF